MIKPSQVFCRSVGMGRTGAEMKAVWKNWKDERFVTDLGNLIIDVSDKVAEGGILVFFPGYGNIRNCTYQWKRSIRDGKKRKENLYSKMSKIGKIFEEPSKSSDFNSMITKFSAACKKGDKAIFLAVMKGKLSEGIDFADNAARAVICVGIPYPPIKDPIIEMKRDFNDFTRKTVTELVSGERWYGIQGSYQKFPSFFFIF